MQNRMLRSLFCNMEHKEEERTMKHDMSDIRAMVKVFRKAADVAEKMADIGENEQLAEEEKEEQLETATAEFMVQMIKLQQLQDAM